MCTVRSRVVPLAFTCKHVTSRAAIEGEWFPQARAIAQYSLSSTIVEALRPYSLGASSRCFLPPLRSRSAQHGVSLLSESYFLYPHVLFSSHRPIILFFSCSVRPFERSPVYILLLSSFSFVFPASSPLFISSFHSFSIAALTLPHNARAIAALDKRSGVRIRENETETELRASIFPGQTAREKFPNNLECAVVR